MKSREELAQLLQKEMIIAGLMPRAEMPKEDLWPGWGRMEESECGYLWLLYTKHHPNGLHLAKFRREKKDWSSFPPEESWPVPRHPKDVILANMVLCGKWRHCNSVMQGYSCSYSPKEKYWKGHKYQPFQHHSDRRRLAAYILVNFNTDRLL